MIFRSGRGIRSSSTAVSEISRSANESTKNKSMRNKRTQVMSLPRNSGNHHLHLRQSLRQPRRHHSRLLRRFLSRRRRGRPRTLGRLHSWCGPLAALDRRVMSKLRPSFKTGRHNFLLLFLLLFLLIGACIFITLITIRFPLLLTFTSTSFFFFGPFLRPVGHRVHLGSDLEDNKQDGEIRITVKDTRLDLVYFI